MIIGHYFHIISTLSTIPLLLHVKAFLHPIYTSCPSDDSLSFLLSCRLRPLISSTPKKKRAMSQVSPNRGPFYLQLKNCRATFIC